jgi:D-aspartate ligase
VLAAPPALVFGEGVTGLAVLRSLGRNRVQAYVAGSCVDIVRSSRWFRPAPGDPLDETSDPEPVARYLRELPFERAVVIPCNDEWALAIASLPGDLAESFPAALAPAEVLRLLVDKGLFAQTAERLGVPTPRTIRVTGAADLDALGEDELRRFFFKPRQSQPFSERFGVKALRLTSRAQAAQVLDEVEGHEVLLQEFIPGPPTGHLFLDGYVDRTGVMRACLARRRLRLYPPDFGNSTMSVTIPMSEAQQALESLRRLFDGIGYAGLFDAEFVHDNRDGSFKILEVNARPWWQLELAGASGLDLALMAYRDTLGLPLPKAGQYRVGRTWVHPIPDLRAWWAARRSGEVLGGFPPLSWFRGANALFSWDDPKPVAEEVARLARRFVLRRGGA